MLRDHRIGVAKSLRCGIACASRCVPVGSDIDVGLATAVVSEICDHPTPTPAGSGMREPFRSSHGLPIKGDRARSLVPPLLWVRVWRLRRMKDDGSLRASYQLPLQRIYVNTLTSASALSDDRLRTNAVNTLDWTLELTRDGSDAPLRKVPRRRE
jgi:hypothetical protein